jgi:hypothetical protein
MGDVARKAYQSPLETETNAERDQTDEVPDDLPKETFYFC